MKIFLSSIVTNCHAGRQVRLVAVCSGISRGEAVYVNLQCVALGIPDLAHAARLQSGMTVYG